MNSLAAVFAQNASRFPERPFLTRLRPGGIENIRYKEAAEKVFAIARWLLDAGYQRGDRVVSFIDDSESMIWFSLACNACGLVLLPLGEAYLPESVQRIAQRSQAKAVLTSPALTEVAQRVGRPLLVLDVEAPHATTIRPRPVSGDALQQLRALTEPARGEDLFLILATSGSTGEPKLVRCSNGSFPWAARTMLEPWTAEKEGAEFSMLLTQTMTHGGGIFSVTLTSAMGGQLVLPTGLDTSVTLEEVERLSPSVLTLVPRVLRSLLQQHQERYGSAAATTPFGGPRVRRLYIGGAVSDDETLSALEARGILVTELFGATETCMVALSRPGRRRSGFIGELFPGVEVKTAPDGELLVRSPHATSGFEGDDALTREAFDEDGFYRTGDFCELVDGYLRFLGRKRDVLHSAEGSYVYPEAIEQRLENLPLVQSAILLGDAKPYVVALLSVRDAPEGHGPLGELKPSEHPELYRAVEASLEPINEGLDVFARIRAFRLFSRPFPADVYRPLRMGKVSRNRKLALERFAPWLEEMYRA